jgi:hypothetical protein
MDEELAVMTNKEVIMRASSVSHQRVAFHDLREWLYVFGYTSKELNERNASGHRRIDYWRHLVMERGIEGVDFIKGAYYPPKVCVNIHTFPRLLSEIRAEVLERWASN